MQGLAEGSKRGRGRRTRERARYRGRGRGSLQRKGEGLITVFLSLTALSCLRARDKVVDFSSRACLVLSSSSSVLLASPSSVGKFCSKDLSLSCV